MLFKAAAVALASFTSSAYAAFGYTQSGSNYVIDAGSGNPLVFQVNSGSCDINSILFRGNQLQYTSQGTHIGSGLGSANVNVQQLAVDGTNFIKVTCTTDTLTQYMVVREGESIIYLATYITAEPAVGELRFIARLNPDILPGEYPHGEVSTTTGSTQTVEGSDVFVVGSETRSKFYSSDRFIDENSWCVYGTSPEAIHVCIMTPHQESSSGGPFFRDINSNNAGASTNLYNYMNSGHVQTEAYRMGLHGPYAMQFSRDGVPSVSSLDTSFFSGLDIQGYVDASGRGTVTGTASGYASGLQPVVHWYNDVAQYWAVAGSDGTFTSPAMKPGTYTMVLYQTEFKIAEDSVTVSAGQSSSKSIAGSYTTGNSLWKIGEYDGQPTGFLNADKFLRMHPSDSRMSSWTPGTFTVGSSTNVNFPMAVFKSVNNPVTIQFNLDSDPGAATLRIATTLSFAGARPQASVNSFSGAIPAAPSKIDSRGVTRGAYRGYGEVYDVAIPAGTLVAGQNTVTISAASGSDGTTYLSPNFIFDAVELFT